MDSNVTIEKALNGYIVRTWNGHSTQVTLIAPTLDEAFVAARDFFGAPDVIKVPKGATTVEIAL